MLHAISFHSQLAKPVLASISPKKKFHAVVTWKSGRRAGKRDVVDLSPTIKALKMYEPLLRNPRLFKAVRLVDGGQVVVWDEDEQIDMPASHIEQLAKEQMSTADFSEFLRQNRLTQTAAAALLGYSRRQIANYVAGAPIPRVIALACLGLEHRKQMDTPYIQTTAASTDQASPKLAIQEPKQGRKVNGLHVLDETKFPSSADELA